MENVKEIAKISLDEVNQTLEDLQNINANFIRVSFENWTENVNVRGIINFKTIQEIKRIVLQDLEEQKTKYENLSK